MISCFLPVANQQSRILILGSVPGVASLKAHQYYGYPRNQFWKMIFDLFEPNLSEKNHLEVPYESKLDILRREGIALWDVIGTCQREGSLDANIQKAVPNDFESFFKSYPTITHVIFNGGKAKDVYAKEVGYNAAIQYLSMPSTSPAHTMVYEKKLEQWKRLKAVLHP